MAQSEIRETLARVGDLRDLVRDANLGNGGKDVEAQKRLLRIVSEISDFLGRLEHRLEAEGAPRCAPEREATRGRLVALGRITAEVGSQLNGLLASAATRLDLVEISLQGGDEEKALANTSLTREYLREVEALAMRLVDCSERPPQEARSDLNAIVRGAVSFARLLTAYENIELETDLAANLAPVRIDPPRWQQLLLSLVANAADAVGRRRGEGGRIRITTRNDPSGNRVILLVRDEGRGVPRDLLPRVFEAGFTTKGRGREGLGLTTCRRIAEEAGGTIELASEPGRGTTVTIALPAHG
jgi:signal transduction histidine kinase